jgi:hypothetical protein
MRNLKNEKSISGAPPFGKLAPNEEKIAHALNSDTVAAHLKAGTLS